MAVGVFGGTFDPVHIGHLRTALELRSLLQLDKMLLIPCGDPPHRDSPLCSAHHRLAMLQLAVGDEPGLEIDSREINRGGPSYTIDTLIELRKELGEAEPICCCIGLDSLLTLPDWHRWRELLHYAHLVVAARPGWELPEQGLLRDWIGEHSLVEAGVLRDLPCGHVFIDEMTLLPVSATNLRKALTKGESIRYLTTDAVIQYIRTNRLYVTS